MVNRKIIVDTGKSLVGKVRYRLGAKAMPPGIPAFLDCSGFVRYCYRAAGVTVPDGTYYQWHSSEPMEKNELQPGDLGFLEDPAKVSGINHIGIYAGNGYWMHCNYSRNGVTIEITNLFKHYRRFKGVSFQTQNQKEDEVVTKTKMKVNGKMVEVDRILKDNQNYVKLDDLRRMGLKVMYDANTKTVSIDFQG